VATIVTCWGMDMSFPSGVIVLSNHMPTEPQVLAASPVNTVINYSTSIGLGMAGTVGRYVTSGEFNELKGYRRGVVSQHPARCFGRYVLHMPYVLMEGDDKRRKRRPTVRKSSFLMGVRDRIISSDAGKGSECSLICATIKCTTIRGAS